MSCAFNLPIIVDFEQDARIITQYKEWLRNLLLSFECLAKTEIQQKAYTFYVHLLDVSTITRDSIFVRLDGAILKWFHLKGELLFKKDTTAVKKTHQNRYQLEITTKFGTIFHRFSSIRECRQSTGLDCRKQLRRILY